ncbi:methylation-associated defense system restriction endonuclease subunit S MAD5 [Thiothrix lacustris]|uniref:methylation-associated defense system restriction endonuclease subunit S MAD5 n=1 Tax=Thiothrix lacustris TaxID=525917 RepID=UPI0027E4FB73|nr:hypothetical protein [Thiothrix lacustris]WMP19483.1 hypothetical protein RCS87_19530 [Thiothrix lacustris]
MKTKAIPSQWLIKNGHRMDCNPYMGGAVEARAILEKLACQKQQLHELTIGIYHAGREGRKWVETEEFGVPFLGSTDILKSDLSHLPFISKQQVANNPAFTIHKGWTLITRSGTIGRMAYARPDMDGMACSEHVMRVVPDTNEIPSGYLYAYLNSKFGVPIVVSGTYGSIIQSIEPQHIAALPVPRLGDTIEGAIHRLVEEAAELRVEYQTKLNEATSTLFEAAGLKDIEAEDWHAQGADLGYSVKLPSPRSLRALNFNSRYLGFVEKLKRIKHKKLSDICSGGQLSSGVRFKRIDASPEFGGMLIGQKQGFFANPQGRWISVEHSPDGIFVGDETVLIASQGTLGEHEVFCRPIFITGEWLNYVYSQHFLRVVSGDPDISGAYLFAFIRSEMVFRCLRSMSIGSKQQDIHTGMLGDLPIPIISDHLISKIEELVRDAFVAKDSANESESKAIGLVEQAIEQAAQVKH